MRNLLLLAILGLWACNSKPYPQEGLNKFSDPALVKIYELQDRRNSKALIPYLKAKKESHRVQAALAFASIQDSMAIPYLSQMLQIDQNELARRAAAQALGQIGQRKAASILRSAFAAETSQENQAVILEAIGKCIDSSSLQFLTRFEPETEPLINGWMLGVYRALYQRAYNQEIFNRVLNYVDQGKLGNESVNIASHYLYLFNRFDNSKSLIDYMALASKVDFAEAAERLRMIVEKEESGNLSLDTLQTSNLSGYGLSEAIKRLDVEMETDKLRPWLLNLLKDSTAFTAARNEAMLKLLEIERSGTYYPELFADLIPWALNSEEMSLQSIACYALTDRQLKHAWQHVGPTLLDSLRWELELPRQMETFIDLSKAMAIWYKEDPAKYIEHAKPSIDGNKPIDWDFVKSIPSEQQVLIKTTKGDILIQCYVDDAPASVANFLSLVDSGFYDQKYFHRVVPNFVIQAGCPRGDGWGGLNWTQRSEFSNYQHYTKGTIGLASAGKDTEGVQWFITHNATPFLTGRYSIFARVLEGMDVVQAIEVGDQVISVNRMP